MRKSSKARSGRRSSALLVACALMGASAPAQAASVALVWTASDGSGTPGGATLEALPGDEVTLTLRLVLGPGESLSVYFASIRFDADLADELDLLAVEELSVPDASVPGVLLEPLDAGPEATQESLLGLQPGNVLSCEAATLGAGITTPGSYDLCRFTFRVTGEVASGDFDVEAGLFNPPLDGFVDDANLDFTPSFAPAGIDRLLVPPTVPGAAAPWLAGLALALGGTARAALARVRPRRLPSL